jgi:ATP-dependent Clp protease ATP-binding subunit ClpA
MQEHAEERLKRVVAALDKTSPGIMFIDESRALSRNGSARLTSPAARGIGFWGDRRWR